MCERLCKGHFVGDDHHGHTFLHQLAHDVEYLGHQFRVERRSDLVKENCFRLHGKSPGDGNTLLLATRQSAGPRIRLVGEAHARKQPGSMLVSLPLRHS